MHPDTRKALIKEFARQVFAERGYSMSGLAEIAERAEVSKTLLYHYFPGGRPEIMVAVMDDLLNDLNAATTRALAVPVDVETRIRGWIGAFLAFFVDQPDAFRLLFREPWGSGEPRVMSRTVGALVDLSHQLDATLTVSGTWGAALVTSTSGTIGFVVAVTELLLTGQVDLESAAATGTDFILGGIARLAA